MRRVPSVLYFSTTSDIKFAQYSLIFDELGFRLERGTSIASVMVEPQHQEDQDQGATLLVGHPLRLAARFAERSGQVPYLVEDTTLVVAALSRNGLSPSGLPGADTKNWWRNLGAEGMLQLLRDAQGREAAFRCQIGAYLDQGDYLYLSVHLTGIDIRQCADLSQGFR